MRPLKVEQGGDCKGRDDDGELGFQAFLATGCGAEEGPCRGHLPVNRDQQWPVRAPW